MAVDQCPKCGDVFFEIRYCNNCDGSPVKKLEQRIKELDFIMKTKNEDFNRLRDAWDQYRMILETKIEKLEGK